MQSPPSNLQFAEMHIGSHTPLPTYEELHPGAQYGISILIGVLAQAVERHKSRFTSLAHSTPGARCAEISVT